MRSGSYHKCYLIGASLQNAENANGIFCTKLFSMMMNIKLKLYRVTDHYLIF